MTLEEELILKLKKQGACFVYFVDISQLSKERNKQYPCAILIGVSLSPTYLQKVTNTPDYKTKMIQNNQLNEDEFYLKEGKVDKMADFISDYLLKKGYSAYSQSEENLLRNGSYDEKTRSTPLPHKTIGRLAGLGWIGKHNLLVTPKYGSAICLCSVLTDAPLNTISAIPLDSQCGNCRICEKICSFRALKGNFWTLGTSRDELIEVEKCDTCLRCMVFCPWTQRYMKK